MTGYTRGEILDIDSEGKVLQSRTHPLPDEWWDNEDNYDTPCTYNWHYDDDLWESEPDTLYKVFGDIVDEEINTVLRLRKAFSTLEAANFYFDLVKKKYPRSILGIRSSSSQIFRSYQ